jgi:hypothetical protein
MHKEVISAPKVAVRTAPFAMATKAGPMLFVAGIVAFDASGNLVGVGGMDPANTQWHTDKVLSLWRLALIADDARARWSEALAILERLKSLDRLSTTQLKWIDAIKAKLSESEQPIGNAGNRRPRAAIRTNRQRRHVRPKRSIRR